MDLSVDKVTNKELELPYIHVMSRRSSNSTVKKAAWSTNKTSDLPKILRYDFLKL